MSRGGKNQPKSFKMTNPNQTDQFELVIKFNLAELG